MSSFVMKWASNIGRRAPLQPRQFTNPNFAIISKSELIEEETIPGYVATRYYPVKIGEVLGLHYQVVGKLGFGSFSTVWLARDLKLHRHVTLKVFIQSKVLGTNVDHEIKMYEQLSRGSRFHPGRASVRTALDNFKIYGPEGEHQCLVHKPLWDSVRTFLGRNPINKLPVPVLRAVLIRLFEALDYMHTECQIIHTDIKADNILFGTNDDSIFEAFETAEMESPCPRKIHEGRITYTSRELGSPAPSKIGDPVLCDFGVAVSGKTKRSEDVQPDIYRSPEVILQVPWSYEIDVWNAGAMIWDIFEDKHMFYGTDPEHNTYRSRAHLAEIVALLGPPPADLISRGKLSAKFFSPDGIFQGGIELPPMTSLEESEENLEGKDKKLFLQFMRSMLQWRPEARKAPWELLKDPWLNQQ